MIFAWLYIWQVSQNCTPQFYDRSFTFSTNLTLKKNRNSSLKPIIQVNNGFEILFPPCGFLTSFSNEGMPSSYLYFSILFFPLSISASHNMKPSYWLYRGCFMLNFKIWSRWFIKPTHIYWDLNSVRNWEIVVEEWEGRRKEGKWKEKAGHFLCP